MGILGRCSAVVGALLLPEFEGRVMMHHWVRTSHWQFVLRSGRRCFMEDSGMQLVWSIIQSERRRMAVLMVGALVMATTVLMIFAAGCEPPKSSVHPPEPEKAAVSEGGDFTNTVGAQMIWVRPGAFLMGFHRAATDARADPGLRELERPHEANIREGFWISVTEITAAQYARVVDKSSESGAGTERGAESLPVRNVSWVDAVHYCEMLSRAEGRTYRLPTVEEWEFACRGGAASSQQRRATGEELAQSAWFRENSGSQVHPVAKLRPNSLGLHDMQGNVFEWCMTKVPEHLLTGTPYEGRDCAFIRGGSYQNAECDCGSAYACESIDHKSPTVGFRIVCDSSR